MEIYPKTLLELERQFSTEEACRDYIFRLRWPEGFRCPRCDNEKAWPIIKTNLFQCTKCDYKATVTAGTIFGKYSQAFNPLVSNNLVGS